MNNVDGTDKGDVKLYALSTCGWCRKTKNLLNELGVKYSYMDVDLLQGEEKDRVMEDVKRVNPRCSFPTMVIDNDICITGFDEQQIREKLG